MDLSPEVKCDFSKLRLSNHILEIEKGRFTKIHKDSRFCKYCKNQSIEDEFHFILSCRLYNDNREKLFRKIYTNNPIFEHLDDKEKFLYVMQYRTNAIDILQFVSENFKRRSKLDIKSS